MKQQITKKQYNGITPEQKAIFWNRMDDDTYYVRPPNIGEMINFLGEDHFDALDDKGIHFNIIEWDKEKELADILWKQVKEKLSTG